MVKKIFQYFSYAGYFLGNVSQKAKEKFYENFNYVKKKKNISSFALYRDIIAASIQCNMSPLEYFKMRMFDKSPQERKEFVSSRVLRKYQMSMNSEKDIDIILDKIKFLTLFKALAGRKWATYEMLKQDQQLINSFLKAETGKAVLKNSRGESGEQVKVIETKDTDPNTLLKLMEENNFDLIEEYVIQHDELMKVAPRGLNTIRIITQIHNEKPVIIAAALKLSTYDNVDNLNAGNFAMPLDVETGTVVNSGIYIDITKEDIEVHPLTGVNIMHFKVPFWEECIELVKKGTLLTPTLKSIGWDVAITNNGPLLIEGNHNWSNILWQLPARKGLKKVLLQFTDKL